MLVLPRHMQELNPDIYMSDNYVVLDKEITNKEYGHARRLDNRHLLSVWYYKGAYYYIQDTEYDLAPLHEAIAQADFVVAQNAKYELAWLQREGVDIANVLVYDTMIGEYVLNGNLRKPLDLDSLARNYNVGTKSSYISRAISGGVCPSELSPRLLLDYCWNDVLVTKDVFLKQRVVLQEKGLLPTLFTRCIFTPVLADTEFKGMHLDEERVYAEFERLNKEVAELQVKLTHLTGGINLNSTKQLGEYLYSTLNFRALRDKKGDIVRTASGKMPTDSATIGQLKAKTAEQKEFKELYLQYNKSTSALSKNLEYFYGVCKEMGGTFYASFNQTITATHRLSSNGSKVKFSMFDKEKSVQFHNLPRGYKKLFTARKSGWKISERDAAQLEYRVAGFLGQDEIIYQEVKDKYDVHSFTASVLNDVEYDWMLENKDVDATVKQYRQVAKASTFKPLFGGQSGTDKEIEYYKAFQDKYFMLVETQNRWVNEVLRTKKLKTITGLVFYWSDTKITGSGYITNTSSIYNYPIQSLSTAEIIPVTVTYLWHYMRLMKLQAFIVNTIHDSIITEEPSNETKILDDLSKSVIEVDVPTYLQKVYGIYFDMPLEIECKASKYWGEKE